MKNFSLTKNLMLSYAILLLCVLILEAVFIMPLQARKNMRSLKEDLSDTAMLLSLDPEIIASVKRKHFSENLIHRLDNIINSSINKDYLVIADENSIRFYHPDHERIGQKFIGGDEVNILAGAEPYVTEGFGSREEQLRFFRAIHDTDGRIMGFVMVSKSMRSIHELQSRMFTNLFLVCLVILLIGLAVAYSISANTRRILLGNDPPTFARMFLQREEILNHLSDGILAFDKSRKAVYKNTAGSIFYNADEIREGHPLYNDYIDSMNNWTQKTGFTIGINGRSYIASIIPMMRAELFSIVMLILRDRTEIVHLNEQIMGTNHIVDALRANTHEFLNKLHVISGLLQFGEIDKAVDFIGSTSGEIESGYQTIVRQIQNRAVAALLLGKFSRAKELNIQFTLRQDSYLPVHNQFLSTQEIITIIGNLTENAFDAINGKESDRQAEIFIFCDENGISISIDDTGCGMTEEQIHNILDGKNFTTKEAGHGYGMRFIRDIVKLHDGFLQIDSEQGIGSSISVIIGRTENSND